MVDEQQYQGKARELYRARRAEWIADHGPCQYCGSLGKLEVDHVDPATRMYIGPIWSWPETRRLEELAKCQVLCRLCHIKKTSSEKAAGLLISIAKTRVARIHAQLGPQGTHIEDGPENVMLEGRRCLRCGHEWIPRKTNLKPKLCAFCHSAYWDVERGDSRESN